ncbi:substrate-binding domain-containing protein [Sinorhizobium arboris]|uniref:substrate-binding domain-containing protein n=1 Tax=Sinorhizobium arboris TaxID=76745 RepID=UPI00041D3B59
MNRQTMLWKFWPSERQKERRGAELAIEAPLDRGYGNIPPRREQFLRAFFADAKRPRAVVCWSDLDAITLLNLAAEMGVRTPGDLAVIGYSEAERLAQLVSCFRISPAGTAAGPSGHWKPRVASPASEFIHMLRTACRSR